MVTQRIILTILVPFFSFLLGVKNKFKSKSDRYALWIFSINAPVGAIFPMLSCFVRYTSLMRNKDEPGEAAEGSDTGPSAEACHKVGVG